MITPALEAGKGPDEILGIEFGDRMSVLIERAVEVLELRRVGKHLRHGNRRIDLFRQHLAVFVEMKDSSNPAGVVPDAGQLNKQDMLGIADEVGLMGRAIPLVQGLTDLPLTPLGWLAKS